MIVLLARRRAQSRRFARPAPLPPRIGRQFETRPSHIASTTVGSESLDASLTLLEGALKQGLKEKADQVRAMKLVAFNLCLKNRWRDCRAAFIKIYDVDPEFDLSPAEAGHPSWTKTFAGAKAQAKRALQQKATQEARDKAKAPPAAAVPPKN